MQRDSSGNTPLHVTVLNRRKGAKKLLITAGAEVTAVNNAGSTPHQLEDEIRKRVRRKLIRIGLVACFVAATTTIVVLFASIGSMFESAGRNNDVGRVKMLARLGLVDVNDPRDDFNRTSPLEWAARNGQTEMVKALVSVGADVNYTGASGLTPLHSAARDGTPETVLALLESGADVNAATHDGVRPLHAAIRISNLPTISTLLESGADVNAKSNGGSSPLHMADTSHGYYRYKKDQAGGGAIVLITPESVVEALLKAGADVNAKTDAGETALFLAEGANRATAAALILEYGGER